MDLVFWANGVIFPFRSTQPTGSGGQLPKLYTSNSGGKRHSVFIVFVEAVAIRRMLRQEVLEDSKVSCKIELNVLFWRKDNFDNNVAT